MPTHNDMLVAQQHEAAAMFSVEPAIMENEGYT